MFIQANDERWTVEKAQRQTLSKPLSVCFVDEYGNSFLERVKQCLGKPVNIALAIPFRCFVEKADAEHEKREGFLMVNDYSGMMIGYGLAEKWRDDYMPLLTKKDIAILRKKNVLCFLDYGAVYFEFTRNVMLDKGDMNRRAGYPFLRQFAKNPRRFYYDFAHRHPMKREKRMGLNHTEHEVRKAFEEKLSERVDTTGHPLCLDVLAYLACHRQWFSIEAVHVSGCVLKMSEKTERQAFGLLQKQTFVKRGLLKGKQKEVWILEKVPVYTTESAIYLTASQAELFAIPHIIIEKNRPE